MNASRTSMVLNAVENLLKDNLASIGNVKEEEIGILPERKVPASSGQHFITISAGHLIGASPRQQLRKHIVEFSISISRRMRDQPNDRFELEAYDNPDAMVYWHENILALIESITALEYLEAQAATHRLTDEQVTDPLLPEVDRPSIWNIHGNFFSFHNLNTDPEHLYGSDYLTRGKKKVRGETRNITAKDETYAKIAGYRMTAYYEAPAISLVYSPLECRPLYEQE